MTELETAQRRADVTAQAAPPPGVSIEPVETEADAREAVHVLAEVWPRAGGKVPLPSELAWVFAHSGNYVAIARTDGLAIGAAIGFRGADEAGGHLHSHIAGVLPRWQGSSVGFGLKQHQRAWALRHGIDRIVWTFDPLVVRNAYFNVVKLGAELTRYYVDFYGPMDDGINSGDETDRCVVTWRLSSPRARAAAERRFAPADGEELRRAGAVETLGPDGSGAPAPRHTAHDVRLLRVPADIVSMRHQQPALARAWRLALREALVAAFADGLEVVGVTRDSTYVVARTEL
jgi:predicted GNAT superfamily acetyltransferase